MMTDFYALHSSGAGGFAQHQHHQQQQQQQHPYHHNGGSEGYSSGSDGNPSYYSASGSQPPQLTSGVLPPPPPPALRCTLCRSVGHLRRNCPELRCRRCGEAGHLQRDCRAAAAAAAADGGSGGAEAEGSAAAAAAARGRHEDPEDLSGEVCHVCGSPEHLQRQCPQRAPPPDMECFQCHEPGHTLSHCPKTRCYNCGTYGHSRQLCHSRQHCFNCSRTGHVSAVCPLKGAGRVCYQCREPGHEAARCPLGQLCRMCNQPGHLVARCPRVTCDRCHRKGHSAGVCPSAADCPHCGGRHDPARCAAQQQHEKENEQQPPQQQQEPPHISAAATDTPATATATAAAGELGAAAVPAYVPLPGPPPRAGRVSVIVDGAYFERLVTAGGAGHGAAHCQATAAALRHTLAFIGDVLGLAPVAHWFDTDPAAFGQFLQTAVPLAQRDAHFRDRAARRRFLTDEMCVGRGLPNVAARLVGGMKRQTGYTRDGPAQVWVQTGVDVAMAASLIEHYQDPALYTQVVLLCGDGDLLPALQHCAARRRADPAAHPAPVRLCGTEGSIAHVYAQRQDLFDFLPCILLDAPRHTEGGRTVEFPTHAAFAPVPAAAAAAVAEQLPE